MSEPYRELFVLSKHPNALHLEGQLMAYLENLALCSVKVPKSCAVSPRSFWEMSRRLAAKIELHNSPPGLFEFVTFHTPSGPIRVYADARVADEQIDFNRGHE